MQSSDLSFFVLCWWVSVWLCNRLSRGMLFGLVMLLSFDRFGFDVELC